MTMDGRDDTDAKQAENLFGRIEVALRDTGAAFPNTVRVRPTTRRQPSFSELAPTIVPYQIPPLIIDDGVPAWKKRAAPPSRPAPDRSRDHAFYASPHAPRRSNHPASEFPTERVVRTGVHSVPNTSLSTYAFFVMVALTVVAMSAAALAYARPEGKHGSAQATLLDPTLTTPGTTPAALPTLNSAPLSITPTPTTPLPAPTPAARSAAPAKTRRGGRGAKSKAPPSSR